jgi:membrane dipeptidase
MKKLLLLLSLPVMTLAQTAPVKMSPKAAKIHAKALTIDTHADVPINMMKPGFDIAVEHDYEKDRSQIDFPRMIKGEWTACFSPFTWGRESGRTRPMRKQR